MKYAFRRIFFGLICVVVSVSGLSVNLPAYAAPNASLPGDLNNDDTVDGQDLSILLADYGTANAESDINQNGTADIYDLSILLTHYGQTVTPTLSAEQAVGATLGGNQYQTDLHIDPNNKNHIAISMKTNFNEDSTAVITTRDGGGTWTSAAQASSGDPDVVYDNSGGLHWTFIDSSNNTFGYRKSTDGGLTWSATTAIGPKLDHPQITVDRSNSAYAGSLYAAGRQRPSGGLAFSYSRDNGATWHSSVIQLGGELQQGFVYGPAVLNDGTLVIPMISSYTFLTLNGYYNGTQADIYALRSTDGGQTFSQVYIGPHNSPVTEGPGGFYALSNLAVGSNGSGGQRLYLSYAQSEAAPSPAQLMLITSDDGGQTWTSPVQIAPSLPSGWGAGSCSVMVNKNGVVGVQYYNFQSGYGAFDLYFVYSKDNGATFSTPMRISTVTSSPPSGEPRVPGQDQLYTDVDSDGNFHLLWTDTRDSAANYTTYSRVVTVP